MLAEVITGKFRNQNSVAAAYSLPASATIGLPILDQALGRGALEVGGLEPKGSALAMLAAFAAFAVSRDPIALLVFPILISAVQLLCLIEGPWTGMLTQRLPRLARAPQLRQSTRSK